MKLRWTALIAIALVASTAFAQQAPVDRDAPTIQMEGHAQVRANPDQAFVSLVVETKASTAVEAIAENAQLANKVIAAVKGKLGAQDEISTRLYSLSPSYDAGPQELKFVDWSASYQINVKCEPSMSGSVLDLARAAGANGSSITNAVADQATILITLTEFAPNASQATQRAAERAHVLGGKIESNLGSKGTVKVIQGQIKQDMQSTEKDRQQYDASNRVSITTKEIDQVGTLIDTAIAAGATSADDVDFTLRDDSTVRSQAIARVCEDARLKANAAAQAIGLKIKRVTRIVSTGDVTSSERSSGTFGVAFAADASGGRTPINPPELVVPATVTVTYELE
jgi:uncharacterized protein